MNCNQAHELLELSFGRNDLPTELVRHLSECPNCQAYREHLAQLGDSLGTDDDFAISPAELDRTARAVEQVVIPTPITRVVPRGWLRPMVRVAAAVLIVAVSFSAYQIGRYTQVSDTVEYDTTADLEYGSVVALWEAELEEEMDEGMISILIDDYSAGSYYEAGEALLGDISEEELEYFTEDFEVGELL